MKAGISQPVKKKSEADSFLEELKMKQKMQKEGQELAKKVESGTVRVASTGSCQRISLVTVCDCAARLRLNNASFRTGIVFQLVRNYLRLYSPEIFIFTMFENICCLIFL